MPLSAEDPESQFLPAKQEREKTSGPRFGVTPHVDHGICKSWEYLQWADSTDAMRKKGHQQQMTPNGTRSVRVAKIYRPSLFWYCFAEPTHLTLAPWLMNKLNDEYWSINSCLRYNFIKLKSELNFRTIVNKLHPDGTHNCQATKVSGKKYLVIYEVKNNTHVKQKRR